MTGLYNLPTVGKQRPAVGRAKAFLWFVLWVAGTAAALTGLIDVDAGVDVPDRVAPAGSALLTVLFMVALAHRCGGRVLLWGGLAFVAAATWLVWDPSWLTAGMAVVGAVSSGVLAVMLTRPARTWWSATFEALVAAVIAGTGAIAVAGFEADVLTQRYNITVHILALILTISVVWGLGAGLHGLGRRGFATILGGAVLVLVVLMYGAVLRSYGSSAVTEAVDDTVGWMRDTFGGVPRPSEVLVGFPALVWGVSTRSSRRQGWWMCAFGVIGTGTIATSLVSPDAVVDYVALSSVYSVILGILLGLVVRRIDQMLTGGSGRRARRSEAVAQIRPEPPRTAALR
ncbi:hypothetical protein [Solicola gregarius]|uniref:Uncharacterized protein n=1 Tax=Solicola gregarius TaxID=2908642 RepID=A0AA46TNH0_9ACTN|nr:hypothetical protein [Solicola gregarius]UYM07613.1 hypothetical protein L0C25_11225 [Solicola gregarius]